MLPLFGRTGRKPTASIVLNDEWCIPTDCELFGKSSKPDEVVLETVNEVSNESTSTGSTSTSSSATSFQSMNDNSVMIEEEVIFSNITDDTFSVMNNETTIVHAIEELEIIDDSSEEKEENSQVMMSSVDMNSVLIKISELERKYEELNSKITEFEKMRSQKGNNADSNATVFVNELLSMIQEIMKNGLSYQQGVLGKFMDELDGMFDIDFSNFDPLK